MTRAITTVGILLFDRAPMFEMSVPMSVFGVDRSDTGAPRFQVRAIAAEGGPIRTTAGLEMHAPHRLTAARTVDVLIVPTWRNPQAPPPPAAVAAVRQAHERGAIVVALCLGAFVVAAAGVLDGRRATTHWRYAPALAARFPDVTVEPDVLYIDEGDVITSAGTAAGIDACLHLVRRLHGAEAAAVIARRMVVPPHRDGGQAQYVARPLPTTDGAAADPFLAVLHRALERLDEDLDVDILAAQAFMSRRTFDRRFREVTGTSALQWLLTQRILLAQRLLESTDLPVDVVARRCGFSSAVALRPHFRRVVGVAPQAYRQTFTLAAASG